MVEYPLLVLMRRARLSLWQWRARQDLWCGLCVASLILLPAGLVHLLHSAVAPAWWVPLAAAGPLLALAHALFRRRPALQDTAAALDRESACHNLLASAWEAHNQSPAERSAGARAVLQRVERSAQGAHVPASWTTLPRWYGRITFLPWPILLAGVFLLQLPGANVQQGMAAGSGAGPHGGDAADGWPGILQKRGGAAMADAGELSQDAPEQLISTSFHSGQRPPEQALALDEALSRQILSEQGLLDAPQSGRHPASPAMIGGPGSGATGSGTAGAAGQENSDLAQGDHRLSAMFPEGVDYAEISRDSGDSGTGKASAPAGPVAEPGVGKSASEDSETAIMPTPVADAPADSLRRFSLPQRLLVTTYFARIQELP